MGKTLSENIDIDVNKILTESEVILTKKGTIRKRKPKQPQIYFTQETENAILKYLQSEDPIERNNIFNNKIDYAFHKLAENIIHTFKFYYTEVDNIRELKHEVVAFLLSKLHLYNPHKGKAYSYFGTIAKRYLILYNTKNYEKIKNKAEVNEIDTDNTIYNDIVLTEEIKQLELDKFIEQFTEYLTINLYRLFPKEYESKTIDAVIEILKRRENIEIFNKKAIYIYIKEISDISTPQITKAIKKLKKIYINLYNEYYKYGYIKI